MKTELIVMKVKCTPDMMGKDVIVACDEKSSQALMALPYAKKMASILKYKVSHNIARHGLLWACIGLVSQNTGRPDYEIEEQLKIDCRWIRGYVTYQDKERRTRVNVIPRSISFFSMTAEEADQFYNDGKPFEKLAGYLGLEAETLIHEAKLRMQGKHFCALCGSQATQKHHKFSQTKWAIEKYGKKLIDDERNIEWLCPDCHSSHGKIPPELNWSEKKFRVAMGLDSAEVNYDYAKDSVIEVFNGEVVKK